VYSSGLAARAKAEEFQLVGEIDKSVVAGDLLLQLRGKAVVDFHDDVTLGADKVMVVGIVAVTDEFKAGNAIAEIKTLNHSSLLENAYGAVDGGQIAFTGRQGAVDLLDGLRMSLLAE